MPPPGRAARRGRGEAAAALALALAVPGLLAGCGQKGPLVRRDAKASTAVTRREPAGAAAPAAPPAAAATDVTTPSGPAPGPGQRGS